MTKTISKLALMLLFVGCTRQVSDTSLITLSLPSTGGMSSKIMHFENAPENHMSQSVGTYSIEDGPGWNTVLNPTAVADVNCYMVAITGPEADMRRNVCSTTTGQSVYVGRFNGAISAGQQISLEVPSGPQREIMIVGFKAVAGACTNFKITEPNSANLSEPHILGKVTQDLQPGDVTVTVPVTINASTLKLEDCQGPDFNFGEGSQMYFGSAPQGDTDYNFNVTVNSNITVHPPTFTGYAGAGNLLKSAHGMITALDPTTVPDAMTVSVNTSLIFNYYPGDEVMIIVMGGMGTMGPVGNDFDSCGFRAWKGRYQFGRVRNVLMSPNKLVLERGTFLDGLWKDADLDGNFFEVSDDILAANGILANPFNNNLVTPFCRIQVVKVPHYNRVTVNPSITLSAPPFDWVNGGGILAFRSNELSLGGSSTIDMSGKGYESTSGFNGDGIAGRVATASIWGNANGGGRGAPPASTGSGGGHGNEPDYGTFPSMPYGPSTASGGAGESTWPGHGVGDDCGRIPGQAGYCFGSLNYKMFMGGAGGGTTAPGAGGNGGGIIYIATKNNLTSTGHLVNNGTVGSTGSGGGAGGSIHFIVGQNFSVTANGAQFPLINADGGNGAIYSSTASGGGGGGRIQTVSCAGQAYDPTALSSIGGSNGGGTGAAVPGEDSLRSIQSVPCN